MTTNKLMTTRQFSGQLVRTAIRQAISDISPEQLKAVDRSLLSPEDNELLDLLLQDWPNYPQEA